MGASATAPAGDGLFHTELLVLGKPTRTGGRCLQMLLQSDGLGLGYAGLGMESQTIHRDKDLDSLIEGAKLVCSYAQRAGLLTDSALPNAIGRAVGKPDLSWADPEAIELQTELSRGVRAIQPVTIYDLQGWDPFEQSGSYSQSVMHKVFKGSFVLLAFLLILACAHFTVWNKKTTQLVKEFNAAGAELQSALVQKVLFTWIDEAQTSPDYNYANVKSTLYQDLAQIEAFTSRNEDLRIRYVDAMLQFNPVSTMLSSIWDTVAPPPATESFGYGSGGPPISALQAATGTPPPPPPPSDMSQASVSDTKAVTEMMAKPGSIVPALLLPSEESGIVSPQKSCQEEFRQLVQSPQSQFDGPADFLLHLTSYRNELLHDFRCVMNLDQVNFVIANEPVFFTQYPRQLRQYLDVLGRWVLPGIYGALGAVLFTMRAFLNPIVPDPQPHTVLLRIFLGAFSGIIVGWFWVSDLSATLEVSSVSLGLLTVAFLFGFSIDVFFALLDRLVQTASNWVANIGAKA